MHFSLPHLIITSLLSTLFINTISAGEFLVVDETYTWGTDAAEGKRSWVYDNVGPNNWTSPEDYYHGQFYMRFEILSQPTSRACKAQFVIWQDWNYPDSWLEQASSFSYLSGPGSVAYHNSSPADWWKHEGHSLDFSRPDDFYKFGIMIWSADPSGRIAQYLANQNPGSDYEDIWNDRFDWFPLQVRFIVVAVSEGETFSGWAPYVAGTPPDPCRGMANSSPTAGALAIEAEDMAKQGYFTQELAGNSGNGVASLYDGSTGNESDNGTLSVDFTHDEGIYDLSIIYINEDDGSSPFTVSLNDTEIDSWNGSWLDCKDEYTTKTISDITLFNGDLISIRGDKSDGAYAKIDYIDFEYKGPIVVDPPIFTIDYINERTLEPVPADVEYSYNQSSWMSGTGTPISIAPSQDLFFRFSAYPDFISQLSAPSRPSTPGFSINFSEETTQQSVSSLYEYASEADMAGATPGMGSTIALSPGINLYFRRIATSSSFRSDIQTLAVPARPDKPDFSINYLQETTAEAVGAEFIFSAQSDMSASSTGSGLVVDLIPGNDLYFQQKASVSGFCSEIQNLEVPARPEIGSFSIDYAAVATLESIPFGVYYSGSEDMSNPVEGNNQVLTLNPGTGVYLQFLPSANNFASNVFYLAVPQAPRFTCIDAPDGVFHDPFINIQLDLDSPAESFSMDYIEVTNANLSNLSDTLTFDLIPITEGEVSLYLPANAIGNGNFESALFTLNYQPPATAITHARSHNYSIYPNPTRGLVTVWSGDKKPALVKLFDTHGRLIKEFHLKGASAEFDLGSDAPGVYLLQIIEESGNRFTERILRVD